MTETERLLSLILVELQTANELLRTLAAQTKKPAATENIAQP